MLPDFNGLEYELSINTAKVNDDKSITLRASIEGEDGKDYSVLTEDDNFSFLTVKTPEGVFLDRV